MTALLITYADSRQPTKDLTVRQSIVSMLQGHHHLNLLTDLQLTYLTSGLTTTNIAIAIQAN